MKKRRQLTYILIAFIIILILGLGYAFLTTSLSINGTTNVDRNTWNVYWDNVQVNSGSVTGTQVTQAPTIDTNKTTVTFRVNLKQPGEYYEFTVDAKNTGTIDAMIDTIIKTANIPEYLKYTVTYEDGVEIESKHLLATNTTEKYKVRVEYRTDINANQLPSSNQSISLSFGATYVQADSTARVVRTIIYSNSGEFTGTGYDTYEEVIAAWGYPFFLRETVVNETLTDVYVGFVINNNVYFLRGAGATYDDNLNDWNDDSPYYEENKEILQMAFGNSNCLENEDGEHKVYICTDTNVDLGASAETDGDVSVYSLRENIVCYINPLGMLGCGIPVG